MAKSAGYTVKSCGQAHAWCGKCRPQQAENQRRPGSKYEKAHRPLRSCNYCGSCDICLGLNAPDGFKICRQCKEQKPEAAFSRRNDTGGFRNQCRACRRRSNVESYRCSSCGRASARIVGASDLCSICRPKEPNRLCRQCGAPFSSSATKRFYCSKLCQQATARKNRLTTAVSHRVELLTYYGNGFIGCTCCGETEFAFLALDHINNDGKKDRDEHGGLGSYVSYLYRERPSGLQILCHNCNMGKQINGGTCPHLSSQPGHKT